MGSVVPVDVKSHGTWYYFKLRVSFCIACAGETEILWLLATGTIQQGDVVVIWGNWGVDQPSRFAKHAICHQQRSLLETGKVIVADQRWLQYLLPSAEKKEGSR